MCLVMSALATRSRHFGTRDSLVYGVVTSPAGDANRASSSHFALSIVSKTDASTTHEIREADATQRIPSADALARASPVSYASTRSMYLLKPHFRGPMNTKRIPAPSVLQAATTTTSGIARVIARRARLPAQHSALVAPCFKTRSRTSCLRCVTTAVCYASI